MLARSLLSDVREIVASMETEKGIDLAPAIRALTADLPRPRIHLQIADEILRWIGERVSKPTGRK